MSVIDRFKEIYIHDSIIQRMIFEISDNMLVLELNHAGIPKGVPEGRDYEYYYEPARLAFIDAQQVSFPEKFFYDCRILQCEIRPDESGEYYCFHLMVDGGYNTDVWARPIEIVAKDFTLDGTLIDYQKLQEEWKRKNHY